MTDVLELNAPSWCTDEETDEEEDKKSSSTVIEKVAEITSEKENISSPPPPSQKVSVEDSTATTNTPTTTTANNTPAAIPVYSSYSYVPIQSSYQPPPPPSKCGYQLTSKEPHYSLNDEQFDAEKVYGHIILYSTTSDPQRVVYEVLYNLVTEYSYYDHPNYVVRQFRIPEKIVRDMVKRNACVKPEHVIKLCHEYDRITLQLMIDLIDNVHLSYMAPTTLSFVMGHRTIVEGTFPSHVYRNNIERKIADEMCKQYFAKHQQRHHHHHQSRI